MSLPVRLSSDEIEYGEGLRDEGEDEGIGEPSEELQRWPAEAQVGD